MIDGMVVKLRPTLFQLISAASAPMYDFLEFLFSSILDNIASKSLAAFSHNYCQNHGQQKARKESCHNDCDRSLA